VETAADGFVRNFELRPGPSAPGVQFLQRLLGEMQRGCR